MKAAIIRIAYKGPPEDLIAAGMTITDAVAKAQLTEFLHSVSGVDSLQNKTTTTFDDSMVKIEIGGEMVCFIIPPDFTEEKEHEYANFMNGIIVKFTESTPPRRLPGAPSPEYRIELTPEFGIKKAGAEGIADIYFNRIKRTFYQKLTFSHLFHDYASSVISEPGILTVPSIINIHDRLFNCVTVWPVHSFSKDYYQATRMHEQWRDAIIAANK